jgi:hypothetical protein
VSLQTIAGVPVRLLASASYVPDCPHQNLPHLHMPPLAAVGGGDLPSVELPGDGVEACIACRLISRMIGTTLAANCAAWALRAAHMRATGAPAGAVPRASALNAKHYPPLSKTDATAISVEMRRLFVREEINQ